MATNGKSKATTKKNDNNINFSVHVKGKRILITKSPTTAISEAKFYSLTSSSIAYIKSGNETLAKYENGTKVKVNKQ